MSYDGSTSNRSKRSRRQRSRRLNADLYDDEDEDKRDAWAKESLSPDSMWKELEYQKYLRNRMRRNMQAKSQVVDGKGRLVTLAERIIRYKLTESSTTTTVTSTPTSASVTPTEEQPSTSTETSAPEEKKTSLLNLLHQYIQQRQSEDACSTQLLEELTVAKTALNENEYKQALSSRREVCSSSSISLGDSATNYNAKIGALHRTTIEQGVVRDGDDSIKVSHHEEGVDAEIASDANNNGEAENDSVFRCSISGDEDQDKNSDRNKVSGEVIVGRDTVKHRGDGKRSVSKKDEGNCDSAVPELDIENITMDKKGAAESKSVHKEMKLEAGPNVTEEEKDTFVVSEEHKGTKSDSNTFESDNKETESNTDLVENKHVSEKGRKKTKGAASNTSARTTSSGKVAKKIRSDDKRSEKDSAIDNSDEDSRNSNGSKGKSACMNTNRAYQFTSCSLERAYTLPELMPVDSTGMFAGHSDLANRKRGQKLTLISTQRGSNTTVTSHILPSSTIKSCLPLPPVNQSPALKKGGSANSENSLRAPGSQESTSSCPNFDLFENGNQQPKPDYSTSDDEDEYSDFLEYRESGSDNSTAHLPPARSKDVKDVVLCNMFSPSCRRTDTYFRSPDMHEREKRVIGLYNELKYYSMFQTSRPTIAIAMTSRPNGLNDVHIEWGTVDAGSNTDSRTTGQRKSQLAPLKHKFNYRHTGRNLIHNGKEPNSEWETHRKPHEFIYLRDLSFSHYVAKAVYENRLHKYVGHVAYKDSNVLKKRPREPIELPDRSRKSVSSFQEPFTKSSDFGTKLTLPPINSRHRVCFESITPEAGLRKQQVRGVNKSKHNNRGKQAFNRLKKRLKLPPIIP